MRPHYSKDILTCTARRRPNQSLARRKKGQLDTSSLEDNLSQEFVQEELKTIVQFIEQHVHWAKSEDSAEFARLNMVTAESLLEAANLVRALCEKMSGNEE
jgi:hypothetical protein